MSKKGKSNTEAVKGQTFILNPTDEANKAKGGAKKQGSYASVKARQKFGDLEKFSAAIEQVAEQLMSKDNLQEEVVKLEEEIKVRSK